MSSYQEPSWAMKPSEEWKLIEIKGGVEISKYLLHPRSTTIFGRAVDQVHIPISHESASRQHARISFDSQGIPWLKDLQSAHGVTVNKRKLPSAAIGKIESNDLHKGARGVMLFPGDMLKFGASTRFYMMEGPPEFERGAVQARLQLQQQQRRQNTSNDTKIRNELADSDEKLEEGASSWGISMSDEDDSSPETAIDDSAARQKFLSPETQVPEKHRKSMDRLNAMKFKLANLETEDSRIRRKGDLTEGQEKQLHRNAEREETLRKSIANLEETLYEKLNPDKSKRKRVSKADILEEEDDFFDRTKDSSRSNDKTNIDFEAESEKSLTAKWKKVLDEQQARKNTWLLEAERKVAALTEKVGILKEIGDEDAFFVQNDLQLAIEGKDKILSKMKEADSVLVEIEKLLRVVNPKLRWDRKTGYIGNGDSALSVEAKASEASFVMPAPATPPRAISPASTKKAENLQALDANGFATPMPKRARVVGPSIPSAASSKSTAPSGSAKQRPRPAGTLSFLNSISKADPSNSATKTNTEGQTKASGNESLKSNPKEDVCRAPKDQDGSGRTKLNEKFSGRY